MVKIENQIANKELQPEESIATIEHILPENPGHLWEDFFPVDIQDDYIYRLGNYTLLEASVNNKLDNNTPFSTKLKHYEVSSYQLSRKYCQYEKFDPEAVDQRQVKMAKWAKSIWKSSFIQ